jgi:hypothetical protein
LCCCPREKGGGEGAGLGFLTKSETVEVSTNCNLGSCKWFQVLGRGRKGQGTSHIKPTKEDGIVPAEIVLFHPKGLTLNPLYIYQVEFFLPERGRHFLFPKDFPLIPAEYHGKKYGFIYLFADALS